MEGLSLIAAEELAQRCIDACNRLLTDDDDRELVELLTRDVTCEVVEQTRRVLNGPYEVVERLRATAHHGGLVLYDAFADDDAVVMGVAWQDDPTVRAAEVRMVAEGDRIGRLEWVE